MIKHYLCGFLIITLLICHPISIIAEEIMPPVENPVEEPIEDPIVDPVVDPIGEPTEDPIEEPTDPPTDEPPSDDVGTQDPASPEDETNDEITEDPPDPPADEPSEEDPSGDDTEGAGQDLHPEDETPIDDNPPEDEPVNPIDAPPTDELNEGEDGDSGQNEPDDTPTHFIINELMVGSEVNPEKDSWIEFYNPTDTEIILDGWQIRGITKGGMWVDVVNDPDLSIQPDDYFLLSYYTDSSYSALNVKPEMTKSSIFFEAGLIEIEIKNPNDEIVDKVIIEHLLSDEFRSYERAYPILDEEQENWIRADKQINLKENLLNTFATPNSKNGCHPEFEDKTNEETTDEPPGDDVGAQDSAPPDDETAEPPPSSSSSTSEPIRISYPAYQLINEFMVNPAGNDTEGEWIELYNNTNDPIDISNWYLDDAEGNSSPYKINYFVLLPNEYQTINAPALNLSLKNSDDEVRLLDPNKEAKEIIRYFGAEEGLSYAKKENGDFDWTPLITPNSYNQFPAPPKSYRPDDVVFKNVLPNPDGQDEGQERITLKNNLNEQIDLSQWKLVNQKNKEYFLENWVLNSYQKLEINPAYINLTLVNKSDQLSLMDPAGGLIDRIYWQEASSGQIIFKPDYFQDGLRATVIEVIDGDTLKATIDNEPFTIRLIGVDAPETIHPFQPVEEFGKQASDYLSNLLTGQTISLNFDETKIDTYNRLLAYVYLGSQFINADLIKNGYGYAYTRFPFKYLDEFIQYEHYAKENGLGLWQNEDMHQFTEDQDDYPGPLNDIENIEELVINENIENDEENVDTSLELEVVCPTDGLKIDTILPNSEKGISVEWIRIINTSEEKICLNGWKLDDVLEKGSKPFEIKGGAIAPGGVRTFRKPETRISLNNSNDCANLINPLGDTVDRICYGKTHKNEIFTHEGGDWQPKPKKPKVQSSNRATTPSKINRETTDYQWELKNETLNGKISFIYDEGELLYLELDNQKTIHVSYAGSKVNISMAKQLVDLSKPVTLHIRAFGDNRQLIGLEQEKDEIASSGSKFPVEFKYILTLLIVIAGFYGFKRKFS